MKLDPDRVQLRRVRPPAVYALAGEERMPGERFLWRARFFARFGGDPQRNIRPFWYSFAFERLLEVEGADRRDALTVLRSEAAESGYDRADWFVLDPPMKERQREILKEVLERTQNEKSEPPAAPSRPQRTRDYSESEAPGAFAAACLRRRRT